MVDRTTQRRVYVLPNDLVEAIVDYQLETGLPSEVEAVRRLLDFAIRSRDSYTDIIERCLERLKQIRILPEVAKEVLVAHPQLASLKFDAQSMEFRLNNGYEVTIDRAGEVNVTDPNGQHSTYGKKPRRPTGHEASGDPF